MQVIRQLRWNLNAFKVWTMLPFVEEVMLGTHRLKEGPPGGTEAGEGEGTVAGGDLDAWVKDRPFDLGEIPIKIGGIKTYQTGDDEVIVEAPVLWGGNAKVKSCRHVRASLLI